MFPMSFLRHICNGKIHGIFPLAQIELRVFNLEWVESKTNIDPVNERSPIKIAKQKFMVLKFQSFVQT